MKYYLRNITEIVGDFKVYWFLLLEKLSDGITFNSSVVLFKELFSFFKCVRV